MATQITPPDPSTWGFFEWLSSGLLGIVAGISTFVWGTRSAIQDHGRRIEALETDGPADIRRLETKIDEHHNVVMGLLINIARNRRDDD
jgi:hypothetical protein